MATKDENLRMQRVRWYRTRPMHVAGCDFVGCGGCAPRPPRREDIKPETVWLRYLGTRTVTVTGLPHDGWFVQFRAHETAPGASHTSTVQITWNSFLAQYYPKEA